MYTYTNTLIKMKSFLFKIAPSAKKLWDKGPGAGGDSKGPPHLPPLQLNPEQMWRDPTWSAQG